MREYVQKIAVVAIALMFAGPMVGPASAHAIIVSAIPTANQHVRAGRLAVRMEFNSRIDKVRSRLKVMAPTGLKADVPIDTRGDANIVTGTTGELAPGAY